MFVDSHAHLFFEDFKDDLDDMLKRARDLGVRYIVNPGTDLKTSRESIALAEKYEMIYAAVGFHPHDASKADDDSLKEIEELSHHPKVVAIGEIGLDYHYNYSPPEQQKKAFARQIDIAIKRNLPIIIHTREAENDTLQIVEGKVQAHPEWRKYLAKPTDRYPVPKGVFHCFPGDVDMAWKVINWGFYISIPGPVTFPVKPNKPNSMVDVVSKIPIDHILLETDSPYLTPVPFRGKRNDPTHIPLIASKVAELQHLSIEDIGRASSFGVLRLFGVGEYPEPVITYRLNNSLYLNITNRCNADCIFCDRKGDAVIKGYNLKIEQEPTIEEIIRAIGDPKKYDEIVFCGYGEPTIRLDVIKEVSRWVKEQGGRVRLNTDGHGGVIHHRNIVPEIVGLIDTVSISLNALDPSTYGELMRVDGNTFFPAMISFAKECKNNNINTVMTIVEGNGIDEVKAKEFVEQEVGVTFRIRPYF